MINVKLQELKLLKWSEQRLRTLCFDHCEEKMSTERKGKGEQPYMHDVAFRKNELDIIL